jgi:hypothetical protein
MEKYVAQLLEELEKLKANKPDKPNVHVLYPDHPALDYGLDYIAEWECAPMIPMAELMGFALENLPVVEKLTEIQATAINEKILEVWQEFNFYADFPNGLPELTKYKINGKKMFIMFPRAVVILSFVIMNPKTVLLALSIAAVRT